MTDEVFPPSAFDRLVKGYFHQDWDLSGPNAKAVLEEFARNEPDDVAGAREAAAALLDSGRDEDELAHELETFGLHYDPEIDGLTHREWLQLIVRTLSSPVHKR